MMVQFALKSTTALIVVNSDIRKFCISLGVDPDKIYLIPAFIPPVVREAETGVIPQKILDFFDMHDPVLSANAFKIKFFNNEDVYGIDLCIELCHRLKQRWNTLGLLFLLPQTGDKDYFTHLKQRIAELNLENNFLFITEP